MTFIWAPPTPSIRGTSAPMVNHVLCEFDGPKMVLATDECAHQWLGVAVDEDFEAQLVRWVYAPVSPGGMLALLREEATLRPLFTQQMVRLLTIDVNGGVEEEWQLDGHELPDDLLPEPDAKLPHLHADVIASLRAEQQRLFNQREREARATLYFRGPPVVGRRGISASFAAEALKKYQDLVATTYGARSRGTLGTKGPIPAREQSMLYLTSLPRGSVGFELQEVDGQTFLQRSELSELVSEVSELLDATAAGDQEYADAVADFDPRVISVLRDFFTFLNKTEVQLRLVSHDKEYNFDRDAISLAVERTATDPSEEDDRPVRGKLVGLLPDARRFEFEDETGKTLRGRVDRTADVSAIKDYFDQLCTAHLRVVKVDRAEAYTLVRVSPSSETE